MAEKPVNVTPEDQKLQHANEKHNELARILAFLEETVKSRVDLNGFERQRIYIAAGETVHLSPPPFARSVVMVGLSSWVLTTMGTLTFNVTNPTAFIPILTPGAPVDVKNPTSSDAQVTVVYLGENPSQLMASLFATTSTLSTQMVGTGTVQLTGSLAPLTDSGLTMLETALVNTTAGTANIFVLKKVLTPAARSRVLWLDNVANESATVSFYVFDSGTVNINPLGTSPSAATLSAGQAIGYGPSVYGALGEPADSIVVSVNYSTLPTDGDGVNVYLREVI